MCQTRLPAAAAPGRGGPASARGRFPCGCGIARVGPHGRAILLAVNYLPEHGNGTGAGGDGSALAEGGFAADGRGIIFRSPGVDRLRGGDDVSLRLLQQRSRRLIR